MIPSKTGWSRTIRQLHRLLSIAFTTGVVIYLIAMAWGQPAPWLGLLALLPLVALLITGLYLFALPYLGRRRVAE